MRDATPSSVLVAAGIDGAQGIHDFVLNYVRGGDGLLDDVPCVPYCFTALSGHFVLCFLLCRSRADVLCSASRIYSSVGSLHVFQESDRRFACVGTRTLYSSCPFDRACIGRAQWYAPTDHSALANVHTQPSIQAQIASSSVGVWSQGESRADALGRCGGQEQARRGAVHARDTRHPPACAKRQPTPAASGC